jgi:hypothetical protein
MLEKCGWGVWGAGLFLRSAFLFLGFMTKKKTTGRAVRKHKPLKINAEKLIEALERHVLGKNEMTATQVSAALALLKKTMPDVSEPAKKIMAEAESMQAQQQDHEDALRDLE